jgi:predicted amidohydrolase
MNLRVSAAQMPVSTDISENTAVLCRAIEQAAREKAEILLTPEGSLSGYTHQFDSSLLEDALKEVTDLARERRVGLALGTCFKEPDKLVYNQIRFNAANGDYLGSHSKVLRCKNMLAPLQEAEIDHFAAGELKAFRIKGICIGGLICNDLWANPAWTPMPDPHLSQQLAGLGARIIFHAVNGGRDGSEWSEVNWKYHEANLRLRAKAGKVWIVTVDNCAPASLPCSAPSGVVNPDGNWACQVGGQGEQFFFFDIEL